VAELEETNARMKSGLEHSSRAVSELQSLYDKLNTLCEVLRMRGTMLDPVLKLWKQKLLRWKSMLLRMLPQRNAA
jgi:hypothetical protein